MGKARLNVLWIRVLALSEIKERITVFSVATVDSTLFQGEF